MKPLAITTGEPSGVGPDICLSLVSMQYPAVFFGDARMLSMRASMLGLSLEFIPYSKYETPNFIPGRCYVWDIACSAPVVPGVLNQNNAAYVLNMLTLATDEVLNANFSALVTAPVHKGIINDAGIPFSGHTEFLAQQCQVSRVVMMLASPLMKVALATTHLPLAEVSKSITQKLLTEVIDIVYASLKNDFGIIEPRICVAGLNPHAGENGHLGREELDVIIPVINNLKKKYPFLQGPLPADTMFTPDYVASTDAFIGMYHDQVLPVIKYASFFDAVNITLGLPIIRTSPDHGTALSLAGTRNADTRSMMAAVNEALQLVTKRK